MRHASSFTADSKHEEIAAEIFISYARENYNEIQCIASELKVRGLSVWIDVNRLNFATRWRDEVSAALARAPLIIVFLNKYSIQSAACQLEWQQAQSLGKRVLPVIQADLSEKDIPASLAEYHWLIVEDFLVDMNIIANAAEASIRTDPGRLRAHTEMTTRAANWVASGRRTDGLLRGRDLGIAKQQFLDHEERVTKKNKSSSIVDASLNLGEQARSFLIASNSANVRRKTYIGITLILGFLAAVLAGFATWLSQQEAGIQRLFSMRGQLVAMANENHPAGIKEIIGRPEVSTLASRDPIASMYALFANSDDLKFVQSETVFRVDWYSVRGNWLISSMQSSDELYNLPTLSSKLPPAGLSDEENLRVIISPKGKVAAYNGNTMAALVDLENTRSDDYISIPPGSALAFIDDDGNNAWLQHGDLCALLRIDRNSSSPKKSFTVIQKHANCEFITQTTEKLTLIRNKINYTPGNKYTLIDNSQKDGQPTIKHLGRFPGQLRGTFTNDIGDIVIWVGRAAYAIDSKGENDLPARNPIKHKISIPGNIVSLAMAHHDSRLALLDSSGGVKLIHLNRLHEISEMKSSSTEVTDIISDIDDLDENQRLAAIRMGGVASSEPRLTFDLNDQRLFSGGHQPMIRDGLKGFPIAKIHAASDVTRFKGNLAESLFLTEDGAYLVGFALTHGGRGQVEITVMSVPLRINTLPVTSITTGWRKKDDTLLSVSNGNLKKYYLDSTRSTTQKLEGARHLSSGAFSEDGEHVVLASSDMKVSLWDVENTKNFWTIKLPSDKDSEWNDLMPLSFNKTGDRILAVSKYNGWIISTKKGEIICSFSRVDQIYSGMATFFRDDYIVDVSTAFTNGTAWENRELTIRSSENCLAIPGFSTEGNDGTRQGLLTMGFGLSVRFDSLDLGWIVEPEGGGRSKVIDLQADRIVGNLADESAVVTLFPWPLRDVVITGGREGMINIRDLHTWRTIRSLSVKECAIVNIRPSPNGRWLLASCGDGESRVWDLGKPIISRGSIFDVTIPRFQTSPLKHPNSWQIFQPVSSTDKSSNS